MYYGFVEGRHVIVTVHMLYFNIVDKTAPLLLSLFAKIRWSNSKFTQVFKPARQCRVCQIDEKISTEHFIQSWS